MKIEYEVRVLNIEVEKVIEKLKTLGATKKGEFLQRRYVYDVKPCNKNSWIRLRTNGLKSTLCIKEINNSNIDGTKELETEVVDFDATKLILEKLGYSHRNYQENKRISYTLDGVDVEIDSWPLIPTYLEIEGNSEEEVYKILDKLGFAKDESTSLDVESIYNKIYNINILEIKDLKFNEVCVVR